MMSQKLSLAENMNVLVRTMMAGLWVSTNVWVLSAAANGHATSQYVKAYFVYSSIMTIVFVGIVQVFINEIQDVPVLFSVLFKKIKNRKGSR